MDKTDRILKQLTRQVETKQPIATEVIIPNMSATREKFELKSCYFKEISGVLYLYNSSGTAILTINLTTGNLTLGGTTKVITCSKVTGA